MASVVEICNKALGNIRSTGINSLTEPSLQAQQCKLRYDDVRDTVLAAAPWGFNKIITTLALLSAESVHNWLYVYQYPSDCLYIDRIISSYEYFTDVTLYSPLDNLGVSSPDLSRKIPFEKVAIPTADRSSANRVIATNEQYAYVQYRAQINDPNVYDAKVREAIGWLLAAEIAVPICGAETGRGLRAEALKMYQSYLPDASADDLQQRYSAPRESTLVTGRY